MEERRAAVATWIFCVGVVDSKTLPTDWRRDQARAAVSLGVKGGRELSRSAFSSGAIAALAPKRGPGRLRLRLRLADGPVTSVGGARSISDWSLRAESSPETSMMLGRRGVRTVKSGGGFQAFTTPCWEGAGPTADPCPLLIGSGVEKTKCALDWP